MSGFHFTLLLDFLYKIFDLIGLITYFCWF